MFMYTQKGIPYIPNGRSAIHMLRMITSGIHEEQKRGIVLHLFLQKNQKTTCQNPAYHQLIEDMEAAKYALDNAYSNFETVVDPDLIDSWIYEMNAMQKRYKFLLNRVKQMEMP